MSVGRSTPVTVWMLALLMYVTGAVLGGHLQAGEPYELPQSLAFNGTDSYVETEATAASMGIAGNQAKTVEAWVYTRDFNNGAVFSLGAQGSDGSDFTLRTQGRRNRWLATFWGGGIKFHHPSRDRWVHLALVHTGSESIVYADGEEVGRASQELDIHPDKPFKIGRRKKPSFHGMIAEVRVWNRALSGAEIADHIKKPLTGKEDGLVGYWPMNRGDGNEVADRSGNNRHGKIVKAEWRTVVIPAQIRAAPSDRVVPSLVDAVQHHPSSVTRMQAARELGKQVSAQRATSILQDAGNDVHEVKQVRPAVLLALEYYKNLPDAPEVAAAELASALLDVLHGGKHADQARDTARDILDELDQRIDDIALAPLLLEVLGDADDTDAIRRAVLEGSGALKVTAEQIDEEAENPYPESRAGIDRYKEFVIGTYHQEICAYPNTVTEISTLEELFEYAGKSGVHVRMEPGVYEIGLDNVQELWDGTNGRLLQFDGDHSFFDLSGVEIRIDSYLYKKHPFRELVKITGDHLIMQGLTVTMVGNHGTGRTMIQRGHNNLVKGVRLNTRGGRPYGYGHGLMPFIDAKRNGLKVYGRHNVYADVEIIHRGNGHALYWGGNVDHTWIDCRIQGKSRLSDDILSNTEGAFYDAMGSLPDDMVRKIKSALPAGNIIPLSEDVFRSYGTGKELKVLGGTIEHMRDAVKGGSYEKIFLSNTTLKHIIHGPFCTWVRHEGAPMWQSASVVNCNVDTMSSTFLRIWGGTGYELNITLVPADSTHLPNENVPSPSHFVKYNGRTGEIRGEGHRIVLKADKNLKVEEMKKRDPIYVGYYDRAADVYLKNETGLPILLGEKSQNCTIITNGKVTDNGTGNTIKRIE